MIHDGFWNNDLTQLASEISFWYKKINELFSQNYHYGDSEVDIANHKLNQSIFFSATIIRKIVEEENEFYASIAKYNSAFEDKLCPQKNFHIVHSYQIKSIKYSLKHESQNYFEDYCIEDYDFSAANKQSHLIKDISNWIIHSYVWTLDYNKNTKQINGFFISSDYDKSKYVNYIAIQDWVDSVLYCAKHAWL